MLHVVLVEPEIPANTGNIARTCAATGSALHLIRPLGFDISEKAVRRAGLDYWHLVDVRVYDNLEDFFQKNPVAEMWCLSTKAPRAYTEAVFHDGCYLFSVRKPVASRRISWHVIGRPACAFPCAQALGV